MATKHDDALADEVKELRGELTRLRDQVRLRLHLGAMDARDAFHAVEHEVDHIARDATQTTRRALTAARKKLEELAAAFQEGASSGKSP